MDPAGEDIPCLLTEYCGGTLRLCLGGTGGLDAAWDRECRRSESLNSQLLGIREREATTH